MLGYEKEVIHKFHHRSPSQHRHSHHQWNPQTMAPQHHKWHTKHLNCPSYPPPPQIQHSATSGENFTISCRCSGTHNASLVEQHCSRTGQQKTSRIQSSESAAKLFRHTFLGHTTISCKWNGNPYPQRRLLPVRAWIQENIRRISLPQNGIGGYQQGPMLNE